MAIILNPRPKVYENIFFSASQPPDSSTILQIAGIAVLALSRAFALAAASDKAREIRDEVGFFQTVRAALAKSAPSAGKPSAERDLAVQQIVSRAVVSTEIVDILEAAGLDTPDISILSDQFLAEIRGMEKKNLALEALRKLLSLIHI